MNSKALSVILIVSIGAAAILAGVFYFQKGDIEKRLEDRVRESAVLEEQVALLQGKVQTLEERLGQSPRPEQVVRLQGEVQALEERLRQSPRPEQLEELREQVGKLEADLALANERAAADLVVKKTEVKSDEIESLEERLAKLQAENDALKARIESLEVQEAGDEPGPESAVTTVVPEVEALKPQPAEKDIELAELKADRVALSTEVGRLQALVAELGATGRKDADRIGELQSDLDRLKEELAAAEIRKKQIAADLSGLMQTHDTLVADLKNRIESKEITIEQMKDELTVSVVDGILFKSGSSSITPRGRETLAKVGENLKRVEGKKIRVIGHADDVPISPEWRRVFPTNWELSAARAVSVARFFVENYGLDPAMVEPSGRSHYDPVADNATEEGRARNRRVEIVITPILVE